MVPPCTDRPRGLHTSALWDSRLPWGVELASTLAMGLCLGARSLSAETRGQTEPASLTSRLPVPCGLVSTPLPHAGVSSGRVPALRTGVPPAVSVSLTLGQALREHLLLRSLPGGAAQGRNTGYARPLGARRPVSAPRGLLWGARGSLCSGVSGGGGRQTAGFLGKGQTWQPEEEVLGSQAWEVLGERSQFRGNCLLLWYHQDDPGV